MQATYQTPAKPDLPDDGGGPEGPLGRACELVGDRWSLRIVAALLDGALRYGEIHERLPAIAPNILSARLRALEESGLVSSERYSARPPRFEYRLTAEGGALRDAILTLTAWGARGAHLTAGEDAHGACGACGGELELRWWCGGCGEAVDAEEEQAIHA